MVNYEFDVTVKSEIVQMDKIAKVIDPTIKVGTIFDKFPPKPAGHDRTEYLELKLQYFEEKEKAFRNVIEEVKRMTSK
ncbi:hypothetical protein ACMGE9_02570 [Macrococcus sp. EM39E]|uniref:hypothetical protein n=1 Tax=Macrococcus animalis TaxID=3395467 RepID=UPI0039BE646A